SRGAGYQRHFLPGPGFAPARPAEFVPRPAPTTLRVRRVQVAWPTLRQQTSPLRASCVAATESAKTSPRRCPSCCGFLSCELGKLIMGDARELAFIGIGQMLNQ